MVVGMKLYAAPLDFRAIAAEFSVATDFPAAVTHQAAHAQDRYADSRRDARDIPFVTLDPAGSMDLDQAVYLESAMVATASFMPLRMSPPLLSPAASWSASPSAAARLFIFPMRQLACTRPSFPKTVPHCCLKPINRPCCGPLI